MKITVKSKNILAIITLTVIIASCGNKTPDDIPVPEVPTSTENPMNSIPNPAIDKNPIVDYTKWKIENGKFYIDGTWKFLKIAKPLRNFSSDQEVDELIAKLDTLKNKFYNTIELNCYWIHFDTNGDGIIDRPTAPLNRLITAIYNKGMYPCLSVETYSVGGGQIPDNFWVRFPDVFAVDDSGEKVNDTEYGFMTKVVSIFSEDYRNASRLFIKNLTRSIDTKKILYFETTVEPQYMGNKNLDYSDNAKVEYEKWRISNNITDEASKMPTTFPIPSSFVNNATWNKFRAQSLANWINGDAAAYREIAGPTAYIAVDYLDATEETQVRRDGDPIEFLTYLTSPNIIQMNWTWNLATKAVNQKAYDRVLKINKDFNRNWVITEHMTFNGNDFTTFSDDILIKILKNTLNQGTRFGWEFTNIVNRNTDDFAMYYDNWNPKRTIKMVDKYWGYWLKTCNDIEVSKPK